uniref:Haloacid dehalogenase-like hydrolase n=1 Tax=Rhinella marina erythrocytic-like virus TaxID=2859906 RepID=A0A8F6YJS7_9VIRU|nr:haloacid dehalogenase-like hydrolase [Rhinella marina erythrocytic-like virus]
MNVILDLDETLISTHRLSKFTKTNYKHANMFHYKRMDDKYIVIARPGLDEFLDWLFSRYTVSVWTAASQPYAMFVVENFIMSKPNRVPLHVFSSKHCDFSEKVGSCHKDLRILFKIFPEYYNKDNTIIIDDHANVHDSQKTNSYHIPPFLFLDPQSYKDKHLENVRRFLHKYMRSSKPHKQPKYTTQYTLNF